MTLLIISAITAVALLAVLNVLLVVSFYHAREASRRDEKNLLEIIRIGEVNHTLLNSDMGVKMKLNAELSRWKAEQVKDPKHPEHSRLAEYVHAAELAEKLWREHEFKQASVDARADKGNL